ncbi:MAG: histone deacetylase [Cytophagaceae bacterium]|nr:histone deacetylase [Gemmatimonadaceae bacterium]
MPLHVWSPARFAVPLPDGHRFPIAKYALLRDRVLAEGLVDVDTLHDPERVPVDAVLRVHSPEYLHRLVHGTLDKAAIRRLGFPWSDGLVERSFRAAGGTFEATAAALTHGIAMNLAGGTHHAFPDHGEGFCVFNDVAIAASELLATRRVERVAIIDLDVHQGNGTHAVFAGEDRVYTFSMHGRRNYPFHKVPGDLDVELEDGTGDEVYLELLADALPRVLHASRAQVAFYLAGADAHEYDRLGRLAMTHEGLARRDHMVLRACREVGIPVVITIAGGYGHDIATTVEAHVRTVRAALEYARSS